MDTEPIHTAKLQHGVTLIELMITITVAGLLVALAAPPFKSMIARNRIAGYTNEFVAGLNLARSEAVRRAGPMALRSTGGGIDFATGWQVFTDADGNHTMGAGDALVREQNATSNSGATVKRVTRSGSAGSYTYADAATSMADRMYVVFNSRGGNDSGAAAFFKICAPGDASKGRIVQVTPSGRVSLDSTSESC